MSSVAFVDWYAAAVAIELFTTLSSSVWAL